MEKKGILFLLALAILVSLSLQVFAQVDVVSKSNALDFSGGRISPSASSVFGDVTAEKENTMMIDKEGLHVTEVTFVSKSNASDVTIDVEELASEQPDIAEINSPVFAYLKITKSWQLADADIKGIKIRFKVLKEWLDENDVDKEGIYLAVYNGNMWEKAVSTSFEGAASITGNAVAIDKSSYNTLEWLKFPLRWIGGMIKGYVVYSPSDYEYYTAKLDRFGYMAIVGKQAVIQGEPVVQEVVAEKQIDEQEPAVEKPSALRTQWLSYAAIFVFLAAVVAGSIYKRMKHRR